LEKLDKAFLWEIRVLYLVPVGVALWFISQPAAQVLTGIATVGVLITDGLFSVIVANVFLRPILEALRSGQQPTLGQPPRRQSDAHKLIARTKWTTFAGVTLAVTSSSLLYINFILLTVMKDTFSPSPWLNPLVFMVNADSILNNISMLLVSGLLTPAGFNNGRRSSISPKCSRYSADLSEGVNIARSQLETASAIPNVTDEFLPPQAQPRCLLLKRVALVLQKEVFRSAGESGGPRTMDDGVAAVIDNDFVTTGRAFFKECVEQGRELVALMRADYHSIRYNHLMIYKDTLEQVRKEASFPELQQRSETLVLECANLGRPRKQLSTTISGLYKGGETVTKTYEKVMASVASNTGAMFHKAPQKGLVRMVEKLALTSGEKNWKPELMCDVIRGALECKDFTTMITVIRLLRDLDLDLSDTGVTGGIDEHICITRAKDRFGHPTSGGWADFMVNFYFKDYEGQHICEVQLVHSHMYLLRKKMGAHKTYGQFRGAKEILEMLDLEPEDGVDANVAQTLESLVWTGAGAGVGAHESSSVVVVGPPTADVGELQAEVRNLTFKMDEQIEVLESLKEQSAAQIEALKAQSAAQMKALKEQSAFQMEALKEQSAFQMKALKEQNDLMLAKMEALVS
jgi:hypothetical protein